MMDEDDKVKRPATHALGQDLQLLSVEELEERVAACRKEIERLEAELRAKRSSLAAADAVFKR